MGCKAYNKRNKEEFSSKMRSCKCNDFEKMLFKPENITNSTQKFV